MESKTVTVRLFIVTAIASLIIYLLFPKITAYVYMLNTDPIEIEEKCKEYWELTDSNDSNNFNSPDFYERRMEIVLWMRVRYLNIDEGHILPTLVERWKILFEYWKLKPQKV